MSAFTLFRRYVRDPFGVFLRVGAHEEARASRHDRGQEWQAVCARLLTGSGGGLYAEISLARP
ncbi:MAG: hypothetical protein HS107_01695 [Thermoflexaceae bacterium]|nr:hypothetical protein [Thermoflexaceae bacterium]